MVWNITIIKLFLSDTDKEIIKNHNLRVLQLWFIIILLKFPEKEPQSDSQNNQSEVNKHPKKLFLDVLKIIKLNLGWVPRSSNIVWSGTTTIQLFYLFSTIYWKKNHWLTVHFTQRDIAWKHTRLYYRHVLHISG